MKELKILVPDEHVKTVLSMIRMMPELRIVGMIDCEDSAPEAVELRFFDERVYVTAYEQQQLRALLSDAAEKIDTTSGRGWFCIYAAYRYCQKRGGTKGGYVDFFADIEALLPGVLDKVNKDAKGDKRYCNYTTLLGREANGWFVDNGCLPPINQLVWSDWRFGCKEENFKTACLLIKELFNKFSQQARSIIRAKSEEMV